MSAIEVAGARGRFSPENLYANLNDMGGPAVAIDPRMVCGRDHLVSAAEHALRAFERGTNSSSSLGLETVLYASGERQISRALEKMGLKPGREEVALVLFDLVADQVIETLGMVRDDSLLECTREKLLAFGIAQEELDTVPPELAGELVLESVAFVEMIKR